MNRKVETSKIAQIKAALNWGLYVITWNSNLMQIVVVSKTKWFYSFFGFLKLADYIGLEVGTGWKNPPNFSIFNLYRLLALCVIQYTYD